MKVISIKVSENKTYLVKITDCNHYYINQSIRGKQFYKTWSRTTKAYAMSLLCGFNGEVLPHITKEVSK